jgi:hypothetical protein
MNRAEFFTALCAKFGWEPTPLRMAVWDNWATQENMPFETTFNPLATTRLSANTKLNTAFDVGYGAGNWNSVPVRVYASPEDGIEATYETLMLDFYKDIRRCFADQVGYPDAVGDFATYVGSVAYGERVVAFMNTTDAAKGSDVTDPRIDRLERLVAGNGFDADGQRLTGETALAYADTKGYSLVLGVQLARADTAKLAAAMQTLPGVTPDVLAALIALGDAARKAQGAKG